MGRFTPIIAIVGLSVILGGCADQLRDPDPIFTKTVNDELHAKLNVQAAAFNDKALGAADFPKNSKNVTKFLDAGLSVADTICTSYLRYIEGIHSNLNFARQETNLLGGAVSGALGLMKAAATEVAGVGIGFSLLDASLETYQDVYLIAPEFGDVRDLVEKAQSAVQTQLAENPPATYPDAKSALESYFQICSHEGMRQLVRKAVKSGEPIATFGRGARDRFARLIADAKANELASELGMPPLGTDHLVGLYWIFAEGAALDANYLPTVRKLLGTNLAGIILTVTNTLQPPVMAKVMKLKGLLTDLNEANGGILAKRVAEYKVAIEKVREANVTIETVATEINNVQIALQTSLTQVEIDKLKTNAASLRQQLIDAKAVIDQRGDTTDKARAKEVLQALEEIEKAIGTKQPGPLLGVLHAFTSLGAVSPSARAIPLLPLAPLAGGRLVIDVR